MWDAELSDVRPIAGTMSSDSGAPSTSSDGQGEAGKASSDVAKMEALLEQLRNKHNSLRSGQSDSWNEFAKQIRMASLVSDYVVFYL